MKRTLTILILALATLGCQAQTKSYDELMAEAQTLFKQKEYEKSSECYEKAITLLKETGRDSLVPTVRNFIAINYLYMGVNALEMKDFPASKKYLEEALANAKPEGKAYYMIYSWMGQWHSVQSLNIRMQHGDLQQAIELSLEAERYFDLAKAPEKRLREQASRADMLHTLLRNDEAEALLIGIVNECETNAGLDLLQGKALYTLGCIEMESERFQPALLHLEKGYNLCKADPTNDAQIYTQLLAQRLTNLYTRHIPDAEKAALWQQRTDELSTMSSAQHEEKVSLNAYQINLRSYEHAVKCIVQDQKYSEGVDTLTQLIDRTEKMSIFPPKDLASFYCARANGYARMKQHERAITDVQHAYALLQQVGDPAKDNLSMAWMQLSQAYFYLDKKEEAMQAADKCVETAIDYYKPLHSETQDAYNFRSNIAGFLNQKNVALNDRKTIFNIIQKNVERNFVYLTATERTAYWNKNLSATTIMFAFAHKLQEFDSDFTDVLFDQQLLAKGLLLTAESALQRTIDNDSLLSVQYKKIRFLRKKAADATTPPAQANAATLEADRMERELGESANGMHQFMDFLQVHQSDVRAKLTPTDLAIEFVDYRVGKDSIMYAALLMSTQWEHVHFLPLIEKRELEGNPANLAERIWQPIINMAGSNIQRIYFAPSGLLYQLPIESFQLPDGRLIGEAYKMYRLSSTRWLALDPESIEGKDAIVYGGLAYDTSIEAMKQDATRYPQQRGETRYAYNLRGALNDGIPYLAGTKSEAQNIVNTINNTSHKGMHAEALLADQGTEASFKNLSGQFKRIIHVATHGFYQSVPTAASSAPVDVLSRCGLLFAGADNKYQGLTLPQGIEDGILTAAEIATLDLRGLDLTTLSACETAQGDITSEGVFGLQRGFKKAGAQSILMSLWKVDDEATCLLMTEFYKNWIAEKMNKHDALEAAKQTVRSHTEKGWNDPKYWAAFILLDGLE